MIVLQTVLILTLGMAPAQEGDVEQYRALIESYREARPEPVHELAGWGTSRVQAVAGHCAEDSLLAGAMLHTDVAIDLLAARKAAQAIVHVNAAARLIDDALAREPERARFAQRWYVMVERYLRALEAPAFADEVHERRKSARSGYPPHERRSRAGCVLNWTARLPGQCRVRTCRAGIRGLDPAAARHFESAAREYQKVVELDPAFLEASLRVGRLRVVLRQADAAIDPLERASRAHEPHVAYLALLYRGAVAERQEQFAAAEGYYRKANAVFRWGMSGPVALAQLLSRVGRETEARELLTEHLARTAGRIVDPLWTYLLKPDDHLRSTLDALRSEVWR